MENDKKNEGEGSKSADKKYRDEATDFARRTDTLQTGLQAEREVEGSKAEYEKAERDGRSHSAGDLTEDVSGRDFNRNVKE